MIDHSNAGLECHASHKVQEISSSPAITGPDQYLQMFVVRLATLPLRYLDNEICRESSLFSILHLRIGKFIYDTKCLFGSHVMDARIFCRGLFTMLICSG